MDSSSAQSIATAADPVLVNLLSDAITLTVQRVGRAAADRFKSSRATPELVEILDWTADTFQLSDLAVASISEVTGSARAITSALATPAGRTILNQVAAATFLGSYTDKKSDLTALLAHLLGDHSVKLGEKGADSLLAAIHSSMEPALTQATRTPESTAIAQIRASSLLVTHAVESIQRDVAILKRSATRNTAAEEEWVQAFRSQCIRKHGFITPPDNTKRTPIPINDIYVPGRLKSGKLDDIVSIYELLPQIDRTVILGTPGGGKSTATNAIAYRLANTPSDQVPLVVILRDYAGKMETTSLGEYIESSIAPRYEVTDPPPGLIQAMLREGKALVLLDGLDELLDPTARRMMAEKVELFSAAFPSAPLLITSRKVGYNEAALDRSIFRTLELTSYDEKDVAAYTAKWFELNAADLQLEDGKTIQGVCEAFLRESESINDLRTNPLLLSLLCIIYRGQNYLPRHRVGVYEKCTELLFETWDRSRGLTYDFDFDDLVEDALKHLAYWIFTNDEGGVGVAEGPLIEEIASFFQEHAYDSESKSRAAAKEFIGFCKGRAWVLTEVGLSPDDEPLFAFVHRTFLEYYAAAQFTRIHPDPDKLALALVKRVARNEWDTAGQLAVQITNRSVLRGAERVLERMMTSAAGRNRTSEYRTNVLTFVVRCLEDMPSTPNLLRKTFAMMAELLVENPDNDSLDASVGFSMQTLYSLDRSGEYVLLTALQALVDSTIAEGPAGRSKGLRLTANCLGVANEKEVAFFRSRFIDSWKDTDERSYQELLTGYFSSCIDVSEIISLVREVGGAPFDFLFFRNGREVPAIADYGYHCVGNALIESYRIWIPQMFEQFDREPDRWLGTLLTDLAPTCRTIDGPFVSQGITAAHLSLNGPSRRNNDGLHALSDEQLTTLVVLSCIAAEIQGAEPFSQSAVASLSILQDAALAANERQWRPDSAIVKIDNPHLRGRLESWASSNGNGFLGT